VGLGIGEDGFYYCDCVEGLRDWLKLGGIGELQKRGGDLEARAAGRKAWCMWKLSYWLADGYVLGMC